MKIPPSLTIGPHQFKVTTNYIPKEDRDFAGICDLSTLEICIVNNNCGTPYPESKIAETFIHEMLHAISGIYLPHDDQLSEAQISQLATGLLDTIKRNKLTLL